MTRYCGCEYLVNTTKTHVVTYQNCIIIIKNVPCMECPNCGTQYYSNDVAMRLQSIVNAAKKLMQDVSIMDYTKAA